MKGPDLERALAKRAGRNPYHDLLLAAIRKWEAEQGGAPAAILVHPLTISTLEQEPKSREWNQGPAGAGPRKFYGLRVVVRAYEGVPWQLLSEEEARHLA